MVKFCGRRNISSTLQSNFAAGAALGARYDQISWRAQEKRVIVTWFSRKEEKQYVFFFTARTGRYDPAFSFGAVHSLDRNVVYSCGASNIFNFSLRVRVARCTFWIVTWYFLVVPAAAAAFQSFCVCVCVHVAVSAFWIVRSLRLLRQIPRLKKSLDYNVRPVPPAG